MATTERTLDPVTFEVLKNSFVTVVDEMAEQILRTCHSFVIFSRDFSCALHDARGDTIMQGSQDIAVHVGTLHLKAKAVLEDFEGDINEGDVFAVNDPYRGGTHFPDVSLIRPGVRRRRADRARAGQRPLGRRRRQRARARSTSAPPTTSARASASRRSGSSTRAPRATT